MNCFAATINRRAPVDFPTRVRSELANKAALELPRGSRALHIGAGTSKDCSTLQIHD